jgi:tetratricopeptide (TPR) repeat protein
VLTVAGLGVGLRTLRRTSMPMLVGCLLVCVYHTIPWVATNASPDRSFARLKTLPLGKGRTEMLVGKWYIRENQPREAEHWLTESIRVNPNNNNAYYMLGLLYLEQGRTELAANALARAVELRPDKVIMRSKLVDALLALHRTKDALPHLKILTELDPTVQRWMDYGNVLRSLGHTDEAHRAFEAALTLHEAVLRADPDGFDANLQHGILLGNLGELQASLPYLRKALSIEPRSADASFYMGYTLLLLGRRDEATVLLRRCLQADPQHPHRAEIERWIAGDATAPQEQEDP